MDKRLFQISGKLKKLRTDKCSSYEEFAYTFGLPRASYGRIEKGANLKLTTLLRILDVHEMTLSEFFSDIDKY